MIRIHESMACGGPEQIGLCRVVRRAMLRPFVILLPALIAFLPGTAMRSSAISPFMHPRAGDDLDPRNPIEITARLDMGMPLARVSASYHQISLARSKGVYEISLVGGVSEMDRDFVLNWTPVTGREPQAAAFTELVDGEEYALLMVMPRATAGPEDRLSREIILVVDTSGSMGGVSIAQARDSLDLALRQLQPQDTFNIIAFNSSYRSLYRQPLPASPGNVAAAREFVQRLQAGGGTEMLPALQRALPPAGEVPEPGGSRLRQVIFITDGAVGNERALYREIEQRLGQSRLFTVGIGSAPNSWFMRKAAQFGRGTYTHIGDVGEVAAQMSALFTRIAAPQATGIRVQWPGTGVVETWPARTPDLYRGEPLLLAARLGSDALPGEVLVSGDTGGQPWSRRLQLAPRESTAQHAGVASWWARRKIEALLDQKTLGVAEEEVRAQVLPVALAHQLLSPYTSFVAVEERVSRPAAADLAGTAVANTRPRGQSPQHYAYPRTATTGPAKAYLGVLSLFLALMVHVLRRPEVEREPRARN